MMGNVHMLAKYIAFERFFPTDTNVGSKLHRNPTRVEMIA
jgi:hypothetical protein